MRRDQHISVRPWVALAFSVAGFVAPAAIAERVYMLSSGDATLDADYVDRLDDFGHTVTIGPEWNQFTGVSLANFDLVLLLNNHNWANPGPMPAGGQSTILNFLLQGGGLVTTEWTVWNNGGAADGDFADLGPAFPSAPTSLFRGTTDVTYTLNTTDPTINAGLPNSFTFPVDSFGGTETALLPKPGATALVLSDYLAPDNSAGANGWSFGNGRVVNLSICLGSQSLANANFRRLLSNLVTWAGSSPGCRADLDNGSGSGTRDGSVELSDLLYFLTKFEEGAIQVDLDDGSGLGASDGAVDVNDLLYFLTRYELGC